MYNEQYGHIIEKRERIWLALSEFYLDTELTNDDFDRIASEFRNSGLSLSEIKEIDLMEVFSLLQINLLSVAGAWAGFDKKWLYTECAKNYNRRKSLAHRLKCMFWNLFFYWMRKEYWNQIERRI